MAKEISELGRGIIVVLVAFLILSLGIVFTNMEGGITGYAVASDGFNRELVCDGCSDGIVPNSTEVTVRLSIELDNSTEEVEVIEYYPASWAVVDSAGGVVEVTEDDAFKFRKDLLVRVKNKEIKRITAFGTLNCARRLFKWLRKRKKITFNPWLEVEAIAVAKEERARTVATPREVLTQLINANFLFPI